MSITEGKITSSLADKLVVKAQEEANFPQKNVVEKTPKKVVKKLKAESKKTKIKLKAKSKR